MAEFTNGSRGPIDVHVHIIGDGTNGSGCWIRLGGWNRILARLMLRELRLPSGCIGTNFDQLYVSTLLAQVKASSLQAAVILAHELPRDERGEPLEGVGSFYVPNDYVLTLGREYKEFLPAVSIHPARPDALDELDRCVELGAVMMKCLPNCHNIDCSDPRYRPFWRRMADYKLPLLAHTGGEMSVQVVNRRYQDPELLREPLECGVTIIAAHLASASHPLDKDYFPALCKMVEQYPNLYGDNSALCTPFRSKVLRDSRSGAIAERVVHGSDLPIPISGFWPMLRRVVTFKSYWESRGEANLVERDIKLKRAMGYAPEVFTRAWSLLRLPH